MQFFEEYFITDPLLKTADWADRMITNFRSYWAPLIDTDTASQNMKVILSGYDTSKLESMFKDPKSLKMEFLPIAIMEKVRNILIGEAVKAGLNVNVNCQDPVSEDERKRDRSLLEHRGEIETVLTHLQTSIGLPPYKMSQEKNTKGKVPYHGNLDMFDELGLNPDDPSDRGYFMKAWHRLMHEINAQQLVNALFAANGVSDNIEHWLNDILGLKRIASQSYVNEMSGAYEIRRLKPQDVYHIPGKRADGKDAVCKGFVEISTVGEVIKKIGKNFRMAQEWDYLLNAVNFHNNKGFTGLWDGTQALYGNTQNGTGDMCLINDFLNFKIQLGYIEWKSYDQTVYKMGVDYNGNLNMYARTPAYEPNPEDTGYSKESWYNEYTYKAYFFSTSSNQQRLFKFGKLFHQVITGAEDEYSSYSIQYRLYSGPPAAEVAAPWIEIAQEAFVKMRWMIRKAKPKGRSYNYESLVQMAKHMIKEGNDKQKVAEVIKLFEEGINEMFVIPKIDGQRVGGGIVPNQDLPNGLDPTAIAFQTIIDWTTEKIKADLAINDIREAYSPKQNDVYKLQAATLESSRNATAYIGNMMDGLATDNAVMALLTCQDIINFKGSLAYKYLIDLVGQSPITSLEDLENVAMHRYATFVNNFTTYTQRQEVVQDAKQAWLNGEITYDTLLLINSIDDYRMAAYVLSYEKQRADKLKQQQSQQAHDMQLEAEKQRHAMKMEEINAEGNWKWKVSDNTGQWMFRANRDDNTTKITASEAKGQQRNEEIINKTDNAIRHDTAKSTLNTMAPAQP